jgi:intein-encoded DNA endonuclease-like protein
MGVVGLDIISKRGERRKYLPLEIRTKMYEDVIELGRQGLKYKEIQRRIHGKYGKQISSSTISFWINGKQYPLGKVNKFDENPSPELAYVIGVILSDGFKYFDNRNYRIGLIVKDKEYAEEFGKNLAKILGKKGLYEPFWSKDLKQWVIVGCSVQLFKFLNRPFEELKFYIEYSKETVASFLKALFDGDGSIYVKVRRGERKRILWLYNADKQLLIYVQHLLKKFFNVDATGPHLETRKDSIKHFPNGKVYKTTQNCYYIYIRAKSLLNFYKHIGFTIKRKQQRLIKAIQ